MNGRLSVESQTYQQPGVYCLALWLPKAAVTLIAKRTTVSRPTIYKFLKGFEIRPYEKGKILGAILAIESDGELFRLQIKKVEIERHPVGV